MKSDDSKPILVDDMEQPKNGEKTELLKSKMIDFYAVEAVVDIGSQMRQARRLSVPHLQTQAPVEI
jgi:hypothetical protein